MSTHAVTCNADTARIQLRESSKYGLGQLLRHIGVHVVSSIVRSLGSVDVETGSSPEVPGVVFALDVKST